MKRIKKKRRQEKNKRRNELEVWKGGKEFNWEEGG